jgi:hypothetical protein
MNARILELLKQAGVGDNWNKADWYNMSPEMIEKFAELIVKECARVYWNIDDGEIHSEYVKALKEHFGIEK